MAEAGRKRILVAMSGGVDSSVAAALLHEAGHEVVGATMKTFCYEETPENSRTCCGLEGIADAREVADTLGIPHHVFDVEEAFTRDVIDDFVAEYARGRTPNPCVRCNSFTKFRDLLRRGRALGCDGIATGHYVRIAPDAEGRAALHRGRDREKDQAYFLWGLPREVLPLLHFPLGELTKPEVRRRAGELGLVTHDKPESQDICFVPAGDYRDLLDRRLPDSNPALRPGPIVRRSGERVGEHDGYAGFTVGQRRGLGGGFDEPLYVLEVRPESRTVVVGTEEELRSPGVRVGEVNWLDAAPPAPASRIRVQIRHRAPAVAATVEGVARASPGGGGDDHPGSGDGPGAAPDEPGDVGSVALAFRTPQRAVTPGQSAAIYDEAGERLLGGGRIAAAL